MKSPKFPFDSVCELELSLNGGRMGEELTDSVWLNYDLPKKDLRGAVSPPLLKIEVDLVTQW